MRLARPHSPKGWALLCAGALLGLLTVALLLLLFVPVNLLRPAAERALSDRFGRPVTIARLVREDRLSLAPTIRLEDVVAPQPAWVGAAAPPMARIAAVRAQVPLLPLLLGRIRPRSIGIAGMDLRLIRDITGRASWQGGRRAGGSPDFARLSIRDSRVRLTDRKRDRSADLLLAADPETGFRAAGAVRLRGSPGRLSATSDINGRFSLQIESAALAGTATGQMASAYDIDHLTAQVAARGRDLRDLDTVIDAGLPGTQPFRFTAQVTHNRPEWILRNVRGTLGRSQLAGTIAVSKPHDRTRIDAEVHAATLDLDDLATDAELAEGAAAERALGERLIPGTHIDLTHLRDIDGRLTVRADRMLWKEPSPFRSGSAVFRLESGVLRMDDLKVRLPVGTMSGSARVVHPSGEPRLTLDLSIAGARLEQMSGTDAATAVVAGRARIEGIGRTVRAAVARGSGTLAMVGRNGSVDLRSAEMLGGNVTRALRSGAGERTPLRCLVARFEGRGGRFVPRPLVLDTAVMRADGSGVIDLSTERLALAMTGRSKVPAAFRLSGPIRVGGTIKNPEFSAAPEATSAGGILKSVGRALTGSGAPAARDADCDGLARGVMR